MQRILVPVDGSRNAEHAVRHTIAEFLRDAALEIHLLNVQPPFSRHIAQFVRRRNRDAFHRERAERAVAGAKALLDRHGVPTAVHLRVGDRATVIAEEARRLRCDRIVMGTARKNSITRMLEDSTTNRVLELTGVPVSVIAGESVSRLERWGLPAALGALLLLLVSALD